MSAKSVSNVDQCSVFAAARGRDFLIAGTSEILIEDCSDFVPCFTEQIGQFPREILIQLEPHGLSRQRHDPFFRQFRRVAHGCPYRLSGDGRVTANDLPCMQSCRQVVEDRRHQHPGARDTRSAVAYLGIDGNVVAPVHGLAPVVVGAEYRES